MSFQLRRECLTPCKQLTDDALAVRIEPTTELESSGMALRLPDRLSTLPAPFFDPSVHHSIEMPLVFDAQPDLPSLKAAGVLASWYGTMAGFRGSHFKAAIGQFPKGNVILLAHADGALATSLGLTGADAQVAICDNPADPYGKVLAMVANSSENLVRLAQFVARNRFTEDTDRITVAPELLVNAPTPQKSPAWSDASHPIHIAGDLNENLLNARINAPTRLYFRVAPDLDYGTRTTVPLRLSYRLSGLGADDHVWVAIRLNDAFVTKRRLSIEDCGDAKTQSFAIPVSLLYSGNTLLVELQTNRSDTSVADPAAVNLQVLPASTLELGQPCTFRAYAAAGSLRCCGISIHVGGGRQRNSRRASGLSNGCADGLIPGRDELPGSSGRSERSELRSTEFEKCTSKSRPKLPGNCEQQ